ncbi:MAG: thiamine phosphate synthase [Bdellovibrionaceae bacterium]|nr:thiamine phosphate synthase [Pseudobdellovibrionaceae bacterium]
MNPFNSAQPFLYLVLDQDYCLHHSAFDVAHMALQAGVKAVQIRSKTLSPLKFLKLAETIKPLCQNVGVPLIINDDLDVALDVQADGLHLGQKDTSPFKARELFDRKMFIGLSISSLQEAKDAQGSPIDYLGIGPLWHTQTKAITPLTSLNEFKNICNLFPDKPHIAIGGIHTHNISTVKNLGASGIAVVSAICSAPDPYAATLELLGVLNHDTF